MKPCLTLVAASLPVIFLSPQLFAQTDHVVEPVVVTATRSAVPLTEVLADVSVVDRAQIERSGATSVADVLARLPGLTISQRGGPATTTDVFIRGAESRFTAVFVDGIRIDSQSTGGATWEVIPLSHIDHIEVLRGPAAAVYGSDAVAGVVQIFTRQGEQGFSPAVRVGVGTYNTREVDASLRGGEGAFDYALGMGEERSDGFNAKPAGNPDRDGYLKKTFSGRLGWKVQQNQKIDFSVLDNDQSAGYDSSMTANDQTKRHLKTMGVHWTSQWHDGWLTRMGMTKGTDRYETTPSVYLTETAVTTYLLRNEWKMGEGLLTADVERREDDLQNASTTPKVTQRSQDALALGYGIRLGNHSVQANARHDNDSEFGEKSTEALAYGYAFSPSLRATASMGTAFRVPTLYQRFSIYGTPSLKPETSANREMGLRWQSGVDRASVVVYRNDVENLINYVAGASSSCPNGAGSSPGCYFNTGRARMTGQTFAASTQLLRANLGASIDWMTPTNLDTGKILTRRPRQQAVFTADVPIDQWRLGGELQHAGERFDNATNTTRLASYRLLNLTIGRQIDRDWRLQARVNNVTDKDYVLASGYATPGRNFYLGLTWAPKQ